MMFSTSSLSKFFKTLSTVFENPRKSLIHITSEASYVYILSWQKFIKKCQKWSIWRVFEKLKLAVKQCYQTGQYFIEHKLVENAKIQMRHFE